MSDWLGSNRKALAILRVSTKRQTEGVSHETQEAEVRAYAKRVGVQLVHVLPIAESGKKSGDRRQYQAAVELALASKIRHVLFYMYDREARNLTDVETNEELVLEGRVVLHYVRDQKVLHAGSPISDFFQRDVNATLNKHASRINREKVLGAMKTKAESGWYPSNRPPLGYALQRPRNEHGQERARGATIVRDPDERKAKQVLREFELRAEGLSFDAIREKVLAEGLVAQGGRYQYRANVIENRIKNPFYEGMFRWQGVLYQGNHERIVPQALIEKARAVERGRKLTRRLEDPNHGVLAGGGWLRCVCGLSMIYEPVKKTYRNGSQATFHYYRCTNKRGAHEKRQYVPEAILWAEFARVIDSITIPEALARELAAALNASERSHLAHAARRARELKEKLQSAQADEQRAYQDYRAQVIDLELFRREQDRIRDLQRDLSSQLEQVQVLTLSGVRETAESVVELCKRAKELFESRPPMEKRVFLERVVSNPVLDGLTLQFQLKKPFGALSRMAINGEWRAQLGTFLTDVAVLQGEKDLGDQKDRK